MGKNQTRKAGEKLLRVAEVAERLSVSEPMVYKLMNKGELTWVKVASARRVPESTLERYVERNTVAGRA